MNARDASLTGGLIGLVAAYSMGARGWWIPVGMVSGMIAGAAVAGARSGRDLYTALFLPASKQRAA